MTPCSRLKTFRRNQSPPFSLKDNWNDVSQAGIRGREGLNWVAYFGSLAASCHLFISNKRTVSKQNVSDDLCPSTSKLQRRVTARNRKWGQDSPTSCKSLVGQQPPKTEHTTILTYRSLVICLFWATETPPLLGRTAVCSWHCEAVHTAVCSSLR